MRNHGDLGANDDGEIPEQCDGCGQTRLASELIPIGDGSIKACETCYSEATAMVFTKAEICSRQTTYYSV
jgi:hypothetical protein